jgi:hypothetical protein
MLAVLENTPASDTMSANLVLVEFQTSNLPEIALVMKAALALKAFWPNTVFTDHMDKGTVVSGLARPAIFEMKLVVLICFDGSDITGRFTHAGENAIRFYCPCLIYVALIVSQISKQAVKAPTIEKHNLLLWPNGLICVTYRQR